jgi:hypothetical protein
MFESLYGFLRSFSSGYPVFWALAVLLFIASAGLTLFALWQLVLLGLSAITSRSRDTGSR